MEDLASPADRAFVDAKLRMAWARARDAEERAALEEEHRRVKDSARQAHAPLRAQIASGTLRGDALRRRFEEVPLLDRDHFVEEVLSVGYPPLEDRALDRDLVAYMPSGYEEIVHALDITKLRSGQRFLDIGAGTGKVALLASLLTGARVVGLELDVRLVEQARAAAADLGALDIHFEHADAREVAIPPSDVVFMYVPFTGDVFSAVMARVTATQPRFVCCAPLDRTRHRGFEAVGPPCSWLQVYSSPK
jgi:protein-L-isoaspartate O-methyltransferase